MAKPKSHQRPKFYGKSNKSPRVYPTSIWSFLRCIEDMDRTFRVRITQSSDKNKQSHSQ